MSWHVQRVYGRGDWNPGLRRRFKGRIVRFPWPWNQCGYAGVWRSCPYYDCRVHGAENRKPLEEKRAADRARWISVLDRTDGVSADVLTSDLLERSFAFVYFDGKDPRKADRQ